MGVLAGGRLSSDVVGPNGDGDAAVTLWVPISEGDSGTLALRHANALYDLNDLIDGPTVELPRRIDGARAINARGQILATARRAGTSSFLLTPRP